MSCCAPPLSCCAQSQHPERPIERSEPEVPGFRDYAQNDEVLIRDLSRQGRRLFLRYFYAKRSSLIDQCRLIPVVPTEDITDPSQDRTFAPASATDQRRRGILEAAG